MMARARKNSGMDGLELDWRHALGGHRHFSGGPQAHCLGAGRRLRGRHRRVDRPRPARFARRARPLSRA